MSILLVADSHLHPFKPEPTLWNNLKSERWDMLILLGDIFDFWVAHTKFVTDAVKIFLDFVVEQRTLGKEIYYLEGNRDFFVSSSPYAKIFSGVDKRLKLSYNGRNILFLHGDEIDEKNFSYKFWKLFSKSVFVRILVEILPTDYAFYLFKWFERNLNHKNFYSKKQLPFKRIANFVSTLPNFDLIVVGHYHVEINLWLGNKRLYILPPWMEQKKLVILDEILEISQS